MCDETSEVKGLEQGVYSIYIKHTNSDKVYEIPSTAAVHSRLIKESIIDNISESDVYGKIKNNPLNITTINESGMDFIVKYFMYYDNKLEKIAPESPLKNIHLSTIFGDEYELFSQLYTEDDTLKEKIIKLNILIEASLYFDFKYLHRKLCAIVSSLLLNADITTLKSLKS